VPGRTSSSDRVDRRRPDDWKGEGRTFANPLGLPRGPAGKAGRPLRQHTRVRTLTRPAPRLVRGRAAPFNPPRRPPMAARGCPAPRPGPAAPAPCLCALGSTRGSCTSSSGLPADAGKGRTLAAGQSLSMPGASEGTGESVGRCGPLKACPRRVPRLRETLTGPLRGWARSLSRPWSVEGRCLPVPHPPP